MDVSRIYIMREKTPFLRITKMYHTYDIAWVARII